MKATASLELMRKSRRFHAFIMMALIPAMTFLSVPVQANPNGGVVVNGIANIQNAAANHLVINQMSSRAVINWQNFSIAQGEITEFIQPGASAAVLNRVLSGNPSEIYGQLRGNGSVFVVNPNGVFVGPGGVVDVGGSVTLSTLDISNSDFMDGGPNRFFGDTQTGVQNFGTISSTNGDVILLGGFVDNQGQIGALNGNVALASGGDILVMDGANGQITIQGASEYEGTGVNNSGEINAASAELKSHGNVYALAINNGGAIRANGASRSGGRVRLTSTGSSSNINLGQNSSITATVGGRGGQVTVESEGDVTVGGSIDVDGSSDAGTVSIAARNVVQEEMSVISANSGTEAGSISLDASETMQLDGTVTANSLLTTGGSVEITANEINVGGTAVVETEGRSEGGRIRVGGELRGADSHLREAESTFVARGAQFSADAYNGNAGSVIIWANNDTIFRGDITASATGVIGNGGFVEVSGYDTLNFGGNVWATSVNGKSGTVLFDPGDINVGYYDQDDPGDNNMSVAKINQMLEDGTNVFFFTEDGSIFFEEFDIPGFAGGGNQVGGDLINGALPIDDYNHPRNSAIQWTTDASFGAFAGGSIFINNHIRNSGDGDILLLAGWDYDPTNPVDVAALSVGSSDPLGAWQYFVNNGKFGLTGGDIQIGNSAMQTHVNVGTRFGNTNLAGANIILRASDFNNESLWTQVGFADGGQIFAPRFNRNGTAYDFDLNNRELEIRDSGTFLSIDETNLIFTTDHDHGFANGDYVTLDNFGGGTNGDGTYEVTVISPNEFQIRDREAFSFGTVSDSNVETWEAVNREDDPIVGLEGQYERDIDGDGIMDGVYGINSQGVLVDQATYDSDPTFWSSLVITNIDGDVDHNGDGVSSAEEQNGTFIPYAIHYNSSRVGNWWWHHIAEDTRQNNPSQFNALGALAPGHGAGQASDYANINVIATGNVTVESGGRHQSGAYIGHGGDSAGWASDRSVRDSTVENGQHIRIWSINGASTDRSSTSIARERPVYGHISVLAGADPTSAFYDDVSNTVTAEVSGTGSVTLIGRQQLNPTNSTDNNNNGAGAGTGAVIGHGGLGQFGEFNGDITVRAADNVNLIAGAHTRAVAHIGHSSFGYAYWNPTNNAVDQIRFFTNYGDIEDPLLRRGELFTGTSNILNQSASGPDGLPDDPSDMVVDDGDTFIQTGSAYDLTPLFGERGNAGRPAYQDLSDGAPDGPVDVEALDGSVVTGFYGDITVEAARGDIILRGFTTPESENLTANRDSRYAMIGHGGRFFGVNSEGSGYIPRVTDATRVDRWQGRYGLYIPDEGDNTDNPQQFQSASAIYIGEQNSRDDPSNLTGLNRGQMFMTISGDIDLTAGGDIELTAGNDTYDFAKVGHGGIEVADYETSSIVAGQITINAGGSLDINGGGLEDYTGNANGRTHINFAQIGHGGYRSGFQYSVGDIYIDVDGDVNLTGGSQGLSFALIGHGGRDAWGQVAGDFDRSENFFFDELSTDIVTSVDGLDFEVEYSGEVVDTKSFTLTSNTANVTVLAGGDILLDHLRAGPRRNDNQAAANRTNFNNIADAYVQIGHGGDNVDSLQAANSAYSYSDRIGDVFVDAGGNITLESGNGVGYFTRIGHGGGYRERVGGLDAMELAGNITVLSGGSILMDGQGEFGLFDGREASGPNGDVLTWEFENDQNAGADTGIGNPSSNNAIQIGHGAVINAYDVVVLSEGDKVNNLDASSNITVEAAQDITLIGGVGANPSPTLNNGETRWVGSGTHVQIGHGFSSDLGNDQAEFGLLPTGFTGDIDVYAGRNLSISGSANAYSYTSIDSEYARTSGGAAFIGHGGYQLDAPSSGNITVYVGNNLTISGSQRTEENEEGNYAYFNFGKIGHTSVENGQSRFHPTNNGISLGDLVADANMDGDITVVVGNNLNLVGGNVSGAAAISGDEGDVIGGFAQIGHGGPGIGGNLNGNITILVQNDLQTTDGYFRQAITGQSATNNYTMIGHGDWLRDPQEIGNGGLVFYDPAIGSRSGNIVVAAGSDARFENSLVGHGDPEFSPDITINSGNTQIAVSRLFPFFGGTGVLEATGGVQAGSGSVFTSSSSGLLQFFMPARSNNLIEASTRLNDDSDTYVEEPGNFVGVDPSQEELAGREDEVYLTPDLWWDNGDIASVFSLAGDTFPSDAVSGQGGAVAEVSSPGGIANLTALVAGALGTSATITSGGDYTIYYDSTTAVSTTPPVPLSFTIPVVIPAFDFSGFIFSELFDSFERGEQGEDGLFGNGEGEIFAVIGFDEEFEGEFDDEQGSAERGLDSLFGSSRDVYSEEEEEEADRRRRKRAGQGGPTSSVYYLVFPGTNQYSSYMVFGTGLGFNN